MSMSTHIIGFRPADDLWKKMKRIWEECESADVEIPEKVLDFFGHESPGDKPGLEVELDEAVKEWSNEYASGYEVDITKLPKDIRFIRFYNSW